MSGTWKRSVSRRRATSRLYTFYEKPGVLVLGYTVSYISILPVHLTLIQLSAFAAKWAKLRLTDEDLQALEGMLIDNPESGRVIPGTGGLRKLRFAPPSWHVSKRGALRVIYAFIAPGDAAYLFTLYQKNEQSDLGPDEKKVFRQVLDRLHRRYNT
jgi:hypothetical protein